METKLNAGYANQNRYKKPGDKSPDFRGKIVLDETLLRTLVEKVKAGEDPAVDIALWANETGKYGPSFFTVISDHRPPEAKESPAGFGGQRQPPARPSRFPERRANGGFGYGKQAPQPQDDAAPWDD